MTESTMHVKSLVVYPIKSFRGCKVPFLKATATGLNYDRRFTFQRVSDEKCMYIGKFFEMSLFGTEFVPAEKPEKIVVTYNLDHAFKNPDQKVDSGELEIPLEPDWKAGEFKKRTVNLHNSPTTGYELGDKYNEWFSKRFGYDVRFVYVGENRREVLGNITPNVPRTFASNGNTKATASQGWLESAKASVGSWVSVVAGSGQDKENQGGTTGVDEGIGFADVAPFLVVNQKSYEDAAARLSEGELDILKFRPNIIIGGADEAFEEDYWAELSIGDDDTRIILTSNCARCASLNVDYSTGQPSEGELGNVLKYLQKDRRVDPGMKYSPVFGRYGFLAKKGQVKDVGEVDLKVGDAVKVVRKYEDRTRFQWPGVSTDK